MPRNKITTQGYFIKKMRDFGFVVERVYSKYSEDDTRKWTVVVNPKSQSIFITCRDNGEWPWRGLYEFDDSGTIIPRGFHINTESTEVVAKHLQQFNVKPEKINNNDGAEKRTREKA
jgi:hypothetical protein